MNTVRVALAEDNVLLREGMSRLVAANNDFELVGVASDLPQLLALVAEQAPDVVVTDIRMPPTGTDEGIKAASWVREHYPHTGVVVLSQYVAPKYAVALLEHGSAGRAYLLKERVASVDELARAIRTVASGGSVIDPTVVDELVKARAAEHSSGLSLLTARESQILGGDGAGQEQLGDRRRAVRHGTRRGEAHQLDLRQAGAIRGKGREPAGEGGARLPQPPGGERTVMLATPPSGGQHPGQHLILMRS